MASISGQLKIGEAINTAQTVAKRRLGSRFINYIILIPLVAIGGFAGSAIATFIARSDSTIGFQLGIAVALVAYVFVFKRVMVARFRKTMADRGFSPELPLRIEATFDALIYELGVEHRTAKWSGVTELFSSHGYWIFLVQSSPRFAPRRFFADEAAERAFLKEALGYMSEAARLRSADAVAFSNATNSN